MCLALMLLLSACSPAVHGQARWTTLFEQLETPSDEVAFLVESPTGPFWTRYMTLAQIVAYVEATDEVDVAITGLVQPGANVTITGSGVEGDPYVISAASAPPQTLGLSGNSLSISDGNSVSLSPYLDNTDNQTAAQVGFTPYSTLSATNVQAAIQELLDEGGGGGGGATSLTGLTDVTIGNSYSVAVGDLFVYGGDNVWENTRQNDILLADFGGNLPFSRITGYTGSDDQTASEVPFTPTGTISSTNVQAAIAEVASEAGGGVDANLVTFNPYENITATDVQAALQQVNDLNVTKLFSLRTEIGTSWTPTLDAIDSLTVFQRSFVSPPPAGTVHYINLPTGFPDGFSFLVWTDNSASYPVSFNGTGAGGGTAEIINNCQTTGTPTFLTATHMGSDMWHVSCGGGAGADAQTLSLAGTTLSISNGNSVDLVSLQDGTGTDDQTASEVPITDAGGYFTGTDVEAALQELGAGGGSGFDQSLNTTDSPTFAGITSTGFADLQGSVEIGGGLQVADNVNAQGEIRAQGIASGIRNDGYYRGPVLRPEPVDLNDPEDRGSLRHGQMAIALRSGLATDSMVVRVDTLIYGFALNLVASADTTDPTLLGFTSTQVGSDIALDVSTNERLRLGGMSVTSTATPVGTPSYYGDYPNDFIETGSSGSWVYTDTIYAAAPGDWTFNIDVIEDRAGNRTDLSGLTTEASVTVAGPGATVAEVLADASYVYAPGHLGLAMPNTRPILRVQRSTDDVLRNVCDGDSDGIELTDAVVASASVDCSTSSETLAQFLDNGAGSYHDAIVAVAYNQASATGSNAATGGGAWMVRGGAIPLDAGNSAWECGNGINLFKKSSAAFASATDRTGYSRGTTATESVAQTLFEIDGGTFGGQDFRMSRGTASLVTATLGNVTYDGPAASLGTSHVYGLLVGGGTGRIRVDGTQTSVASSPTMDTTADVSICSRSGGSLHWLGQQSIVAVWDADKAADAASIESALAGGLYE